jgi:hypothetical protein
VKELLQAQLTFMDINRAETYSLHIAATLLLILGFVKAAQLFASDMPAYTQQPPSIYSAGLPCGGSKR